MSVAYPRGILDKYVREPVCKFPAHAWHVLAHVDGESRVPRPKKGNMFYRIAILRGCTPPFDFAKLDS